MHTEHLQNVGFARVAAGWLVAIAVTSLVVLVFEASGLGTSGTGAANAFASLVSVAAGFWAGGFFAGFRSMSAPILHGVGMGIASIVVWVVINALASLVSRSAGWAGIGPGLAVGLVLVQMIAAVVGALMGYNVALRGKPGLSEDIPADLSR